MPALNGKALNGKTSKASKTSKTRRTSTISWTSASCMASREREALAHK